MSKLTLYGIWLSGPTYKAGLAMSLMGQAFRLQACRSARRRPQAADYLAINRFGQVPALVDGDLKLCQSGSILLYLADKFGKMGGKTAEEKARVREWLFWESDRLAPNVYRPRAIKRGFMKADDNVYQLYTGLANDALKVLDASLAKSAFLVGNEPTVADVAVYGDVAYAEEGAIDLAPYRQRQGVDGPDREAAGLQEVRGRAAEAGRGLIIAFPSHVPLPLGGEAR